MEGSSGLLLRIQRVRQIQPLPSSLLWALSFTWCCKNQHPPVSAAFLKLAHYASQGVCLSSLLWFIKPCPVASLSLPYRSRYHAAFVAINGLSSSACIWGLVRIIYYLVLFKCFPWVSQFCYLVALSVFMRGVK